ncbi:polyprenol monophosphomannose synthase [Pseudactinotalea sp. Z1739]|uniref:polyprenol monophosphomannose synthase n=1 Tax=Pseudactinotalea sp. Z1739 TaxID=3413028 RepID=UPI003C7E0FC0
MTASAARVVVVIPTYNERTSLPVTLSHLRQRVPGADVLVVDDASPDGTGAWAGAVAEQDPQVHVLHRAGKEGLGPAYLAGFAWALERGYDVLVEMDADGSHRAEDLPALLTALTSGVDLVIGSRWIPGGAVQNWPAHRRWLSRSANRYAKAALGLGVRDATAGFRAYPADTLRGLDLAGVASQGYCFQIDLTWRVHRGGGLIVEVPITFVEREQGTSKMDRSIVVEALWRVTAWGVQARITGLRAWAQALWRRN